MFQRTFMFKIEQVPEKVSSENQFHCELFLCVFILIKIVFSCEELDRLNSWPHKIVVNFYYTCLYF